MAQAHAQTETWYVSPAIVYTDDDPDRQIQDEIGGGQIHVGRHMSDHFTLEGLFGYSNISGWPGPGGTTPDQQHLDNIRIKNVTIRNAKKTYIIKNVDNLSMKEININGADHSIINKN